MNQKTRDQLVELGRHLGERRISIIEAWRALSSADPAQTTGDSLTRTQFYDHIPDILETFEQRLKTASGAEIAESATDEETHEEAQHGLHRWQQGYRLSEILREWGYLHLCLHDELKTFVASDTELDLELMAVANRELIKFINGAVDQSGSQYVRLEQDLAAGRARDLERAIADLAEVDRQRGELIRQAVHDLGGNVQAVSTAASVLTGGELPDSMRKELSNVVKRGVTSVRSLLTDLMSLARLEAGQEQRVIASFDAAELLTGLCAASKPLAVEKALTLELSGDDSFTVNGDCEKVQRIAQNLLLNAIKYTDQGGVSVTWGAKGSKQWWFNISDTGPGIVAPGDASQAPENGPTETTPDQLSGEGIGLLIVKRLCELIDASLEMTTTPATGTTFRVLLPRKYAED